MAHINFKMGTNYYRIPTAEEMESRKSRLQRDIEKMTMSPSDIERGFPFIDPFKESWEIVSPWDIFRDGTSIHLGKRSGGWKFCWNFHNNKHYSNKEELLSFIRSGRIVDEYGEEWNVEEFITMALEWGQPDGWVVNDSITGGGRNGTLGAVTDAFANTLKGLADVTTSKNRGNSCAAASIGSRKPRIIS